MYQSALGLEYLHKVGIVHGDLHARNILIDENGQARLTDFGLSLLADATPHGSYGSVHGGGVFLYRSPELHDPERFGLGSSMRPTTLSDIFAFGCKIGRAHV